MQPSSSSSSFLCYYQWFHLNFSFCVILCVSHFPHFAASLGGSESDIYPQLSHRILWETLCIHCSSCTRSTNHRACACISLTPHNTIINIQRKHRCLSHRAVSFEKLKLCGFDLRYLCLSVFFWWTLYQSQQLKLHPCRMYERGTLKQGFHPAQTKKGQLRAVGPSD